VRDVTPDELGGSIKTAVVIGPFGSNLKTSDFTDSGVPLIFVRDIRAGDFLKPRAFVSEEKARELGAHIALPGDLVVTKMGDPPGDVAVYDGPVPAVITADCIRLRPARGYDTRYLLHAFKAPHVRQQVLGITSGAAQKKVSLERFRHRVAVPVPSLPEQRRIAAILDHADALRAKRRQVLAHLDALNQSTFHDVFGDMSQFEKSLLLDLAQVSSGITKGRKTGDPTTTTPYLAVSNVQAGYLAMDVVKTIDATATEIARYALKNGDLVLTEGGDPDKLGRGTVWRNELPLCLHQNHIFRVRLDASARVLPDYLSAYMADRNARSYFLRSAKQTTGIASINMTQLKALPVAVPPLDMQRKYLEAVRHVAASRAAVQRVGIAHDELFTSLQSRAFRGEL
jgi:type I restriction enzyme S subunit